MSPPYPYILNSIFWSLVGGGGGYYFGRLRADVYAIKKKVVMDSETANETPGRKHWWSLHSRDSQQAMGIVIVVMSLATVALVLYQKVQLDRVTHCYIAALKVRDHDSTQSRQFAIDYTASTEHMIDTILSLGTPTAPPTPEQRAGAFQAISEWKTDNHTYRTSLQKTQRSAQANPLFATSC